MSQHLSVANKKTQKGMSLISLMVGLLLAMIGILAGLMLYKNIVHTTVQTRSDALQDGQIASAMLSLQLELQSAGFGLDKEAGGEHIRLVGSSLFWRYTPTTGTAQCREFRIQDDADQTKRELYLIKLKSGCDETTVLSSFDWNDDDDIELYPLAEFKKSDATAVDLPHIAVSIEQAASCFPYGMGAKDTHPMVTIVIDNAAITAAKKSAPTATAPNAPFRYDFCLSNI